MANEPNYRDSVEGKLLRYLLEHPSAADGAEGVRHWWASGWWTKSDGG